MEILLHQYNLDEVKFSPKFVQSLMQFAKTLSGNHYNSIVSALCCVSLFSKDLDLQGEVKVDLLAGLES
jgi:hypothetical protein